MIQDPDLIDDDAIEAMAQKLYRSQFPTLGERALDVPVRIGRGVVQGVGSAITGLGALERGAGRLLPDEVAQFTDTLTQPALDAGKAIEDFAPRGNPKLDEDLISQGAEAVGSSIPSIGAGLATGGLGAVPALATLGTTSVLQEAGGGYREALDRGGTESQALKAAALTAPAGLLDVVEGSQALRFLNKVGRKVETGAATSLLERMLLSTDSVPLPGRMALSAGGEAIQETAQGGWEQYAQELAGTITSDEQAQSFLDLARSNGAPAALSSAVIEAVLHYASRGVLGARSHRQRAVDPRTEPTQNPDGSFSPPADLASNAPKAAGADLTGDRLSDEPKPSTRIDLPDEPTKAAVERFQAQPILKGVQLETHEAPSSLQDHASGIGLRVVGVRDPSGSSLPAAGMYDEDTKTAVIDLNAAPDEQLGALLRHEQVHFAKDEHPEAFQGFADAIEEAAPGWLAEQSANREGRQRQAAAPVGETAKGKPVFEQGPILEPGTAHEEAVAEGIQNIPTYLELYEQDPTLAVKIATYKPGIVRSMADMLVDLAHRLRLTSDVSVSKQIKGLRNYIAASGTEFEQKHLTPQAGAALALKVAEIERSMRAATPAVQPTGNALPSPDTAEFPVVESDAAFPKPELPIKRKASGSKLTEEDYATSKAGPQIKAASDAIAQFDRELSALKSKPDNRFHRRQIKRLEERADQARTTLESLRAETRRAQPKAEGDTVRLPSGETGKVVKVEGENLRVLVEAKSYGPIETTLGLREKRVRTVSTNEVELVEASPKKESLPVTEKTTETTEAPAQPTARTQLPITPRASNSPVLRSLLGLARRQSRYKGNKSEALEKNAGVLNELSRQSLQDVGTVFDMYAGGGTYGLTYVASGATPKAKRLVVNEIDDSRRTKFQLAMKEGGEFLNEWDINRALIDLRAQAEPLIVNSSTPAATLLEKYEKTDAFRALSPRAQAAIYAIADVAHSGRTNGWEALRATAYDDAGRVKQLADKVRAKGVTIEVTAHKAESPEARKMISDAGRSLVIADPPYRATSNAGYTGADLGSAENMRTWIRAAKDAVSGNVLVYHNSGASDVSQELRAAFGDRVYTREWSRNARGKSKADQVREILAIYDDKGLDKKALDAAAGDTFAGRARLALPIQPRKARYALPIVPRDDLGFYSRLEQIVTALPDKISAATALNKIKAQGSKEEIHYSGIDTFLAGKDKVTKAEILDYLKTNGVRVTEKMLGDGGLAWNTSSDVELTVVSDETDAEEDENESPVRRILLRVEATGHDYYAMELSPGVWHVEDEDGKRIHRTGLGRLRLVENAIRDHEFYLAESEGAVSNAKYQQYQTPGGTNYRELLLTLPGNKFTGGHFDEPGILAHVRMNDRTGPNGEKTLFVEEIQSDLHQKGRERGYHDAEADNRATAARNAALQHERELAERLRQEWKLNLPENPSSASVFNKLNAMINEVNTTTPEGRKWWNDLKAINKAWDANRAAQAEFDKHRNNVPDAPFKETWPELALKRVLLYAAEKGYDVLAWTRGSQQIDRYNESMRQNVDKIEVEPRGKKRSETFHIGKVGNMEGLPWAVSMEHENGDLFVWNYFETRSAAEEAIRKYKASHGGDADAVYIRAHKNGQERFGAEVPINGLTNLHGHEVGLEDVIGKELARKVREDPSKTHTFEGEGLAIGGKGMQDFYDRMLPSIAKKLTKNEVGEMDLPHYPPHEKGMPKGPASTVHAVPIPVDTIKKEGFARMALPPPPRGKKPDINDFIRSNVKERYKRIGEGGSTVKRPLANPDPNLKSRRLAEAIQEYRLDHAEKHTIERGQRELAELNAKDPEGVETLRRLLAGEPLDVAHRLQAQQIKRRDLQRATKTWSDEDLTRAIAVEYHYDESSSALSAALRAATDFFETRQDRFLSTLAGITKAGREAMKKAKTLKQKDKIVERELVKIRKARFALMRAGFDVTKLTEDYYKDDATYNRMADIAARAKGEFWDWFYAWRSAAMQAGTLSAIRNPASNMAHILFDNVLPKTFSSLPNETKDYIADMVAAVPEAMRLGYSSWRYGLWEGTSVDEQFVKAPNWLGLRYLEAISTNVNAGQDAFFRHVVASAELRAAARSVSKQTGLTVEHLLTSPQLLEEAEEAGRKSVFGDRDRFTRALNSLRSIADIGGFSPGKLVVPFISTPAKIVQASLEAAAGPVVPIAKLAADATGVRSKMGLAEMTRDEKLRELGKLLVGLGLWAAVYALVNKKRDDGLPWITGSRARGAAGQQQERIAPAYSVTNPFTGNYMSYQTLDPFGTALPMMIDVLQGNTTVPASFAETLKDKTFFRGIQQLYEAATDDRKGKLGAWVRGTLWQPMVPNLIRTTAPRAEEETTFDIPRSNADTLAPKALAYAATGLKAFAPPLRYDRWGRPVQKAGRSWFARMAYLMPTTREPGEIEPIDLLIERYRDEEGKPVVFRAPGLTFQRNGVTIEMSPEEYSDLTRDAGQRAIAALRPWAARKKELTEADVKHIHEVIRDAETAEKNKIVKARGTR